jgi:hypothetical protein
MLTEGFVESFVDFFYLTHKKDATSTSEEAEEQGTEIYFIFHFYYSPLLISLFGGNGTKQLNSAYFSFFSRCDSLYSLVLYSL